MINSFQDYISAAIIMNKYSNVKGNFRILPVIHEYYVYSFSVVLPPLCCYSIKKHPHKVQMIFL